MARRSNITDTVEMQDCVVYARYSSHSQKDTSIEDQVADIEVFCRQNNLRIVHVYADRHISGKTDDREDFQQMIKDAAHRQWSYVVVWKTDRFARNRYDSANYKYKLKKYGVRVLSAKESIPDGPEGILLESVLEGSAEYYSANLAQNIRRGMLSNAQACKANSGAFPLGYCKGQDGKFAICEAEAEVVREIFRKVAAGVTFVQLQNELNARGIRTKWGNLWNKNSFHRILTNEVYIGVYHFSDVRIEGGVPAIIDKELFVEVQHRLKTKKNPQGRHRNDNEFMLTGKLFCGLCGLPMIGLSGTSRHGNKHCYYTCQGRRQKKGCQKENVRRDWLERLVVSTTLEYVLRDDVIEWIADQVMAFQEREANTVRLRSLRNELVQKEKALDNILKAIEAGIITASTKRRLEELEAEVKQTEMLIRVEERAMTRIERDFIIYWLEKFKDGSIENAGFRRKVIDTFVSAVYLWDDHLRIAFNYTGKNKNVVESNFVVEAETLAGPEGSYKLSEAPPNKETTRKGGFNLTMQEMCGFIFRCLNGSCSFFLKIM